MATRKTARPRATQQTKQVAPDLEEVLTLDWNLVDLPSSQHRAGLAGLVLVVRWLERKGTIKGICRLSRVDARGATLELSLIGLRSLFDEIYAASVEEVERAQPLKDRTNGEKLPLRTVERTVRDARGKERTETVYVYPQIVPAGSFLADADSTVAGKSGLWIKLWRDLVWGVLRAIPATRGPFKARAAGEEASDVVKTWSELTRLENPSVELPSTYFVGAQSSTAEAVGFSDRARPFFLLHFWPFAAPIYVPQIIKFDGKRDPVGFALVFADVRDLDGFCAEYHDVLERRGSDASGYRPRDAVIDIVVEGALDFMARLVGRLSIVEGRKATADVVFGYDVVHLEREGNNVRVRSTARVEPDLVMVDRYSMLRGVYWNARFRRQRLLNLVGRRPWYWGFASLAATVPSEQLIGDSYFRRDVRMAFTEVETTCMENNGEQRTEKSIEQLVYIAVGNFVSRRVKSKTQLEWEIVKDNPGQKQKYEEARQKVAKDAFLQVRSRTGSDFIEFFTGTLCSVPQHVGTEGYLSLSRALLSDPDTIRTLTLLALSARG